jgi:outer membrane lipoprotein SlyB
MIVVPVVLVLTACGPNYSPDTYSNNAVQQANKVDAGVIVGMRPVQISAQGAIGGVTGAAAGGVAGSQIGAGPTSAFSAIGGSLIGGIAGVTAEHIVGDANGFEYVVRKANGDLVSVAQKDTKALPVGQKVLVIGGTQARIVPDYTVPSEEPPKAAAKPPVPDAPAHVAAPGEAVFPPPAGIVAPPPVPGAFEGRGTAPPPILVPPATAEAK